MTAHPNPEPVQTVDDDNAPSTSAQSEVEPDAGSGPAADLPGQGSTQPQQDDADFADFPDRPEPRLIGRHGLQQLDLLLMTIEALDFRSGEVMFDVLRQQDGIPESMSRVEFWKWRTTNPQRRSMRRIRLKEAEVMTMVSLVCDMAARFYTVLHQLVSVRVDQSTADARWMLLTKRLQDLIQKRMNIKRMAMQKFADDDHALAMTRQMVRALMFSAGPGGQQRLLASLQDGMRR